MAQTATSRHLTYAEYLAAEELSVEKHEYCDGAVVAMAGGTTAHAHLIMNLSGTLFAKLAGKRCRPFGEAQRIRVPATGLATYPDLSVICGRVEHDEVDRDAAINPTVLFEVLSPSTAGDDQGEKFDHYAQLQSLKAYVLVDYKREHVDLYTRSDDGAWVRRGFGSEDKVPIEAIDVEIAVTAIYEGWAELR